MPDIAGEVEIAGFALVSGVATSSDIASLIALFNTADIARVERGGEIRRTASSATLAANTPSSAGAAFGIRPGRTTAVSTGMGADGFIAPPLAAGFDSIVDQHASVDAPMKCNNVKLLYTC